MRRAAGNPMTLTMKTLLPRPVRPLLAGLLAATAALPAAAGDLIEIGGSASRYSAGLPDGGSAHLRGSWAFGTGTVVNAELLGERKFDARGGVASAGVTRTIDEDWFASAALAGGWGGPNWNRSRVDAAVSRKWGAERRWITTLGGYHARFDAGRSDSGLKISANYYANHFAVFELGATLNRSRPGNVGSTMPWLAVTLGVPGVQTLALRVSRGREAWLVLGDTAQPVDFASTTVGADWRWWIAPDWGVVLRAESYRNPSYRRTTLGGGVFMQM